MNKIPFTHKSRSKEVAINQGLIERNEERTLCFMSKRSVCQHWPPADPFFVRFFVEKRSCSYAFKILVFADKAL